MREDMRPLNRPEDHLREREAAFQQYDPIVTSILSDLKAALFPRSYRLDRHKAGDWYLSPPDHVMSISPVSVKLRFDANNRPVGFKVTNYVDWAPVEECDLSKNALDQAVRKLFPRYQKS